MCLLIAFCWHDSGGGYCSGLWRHYNSPLILRHLQFYHNKLH